MLTGSISEVLALNSESSCLTGGFSTSSIFILSEHLYVIIESGVIDARITKLLKVYLKVAHTPKVSAQLISPFRTELMHLATRVDAMTFR